MDNKKSPVNLLPENIDKLNELLNCIEHIQTKDDSIYIKFKKDLILQTENHIAIHSNNGQIAIKGKLLHLNPETCISKYFEKQNYVNMTDELENENRRKLEESKKQLLENPKTCDC